MQAFELAGPGFGKAYKLVDGALALVDGCFILVHGNEKAVEAGYGRYAKQGDFTTLHVRRWTRVDQSAAFNLHDTAIQARFDGRLFSNFHVIP